MGQVSSLREMLDDASVYQTEPRWALSLKWSDQGLRGIPYHVCFESGLQFVKGVLSVGPISDQVSVRLIGIFQVSKAWQTQHPGAVT